MKSWQKHEKVHLNRKGKKQLNKRQKPTKDDDICMYWLVYFFHLGHPFERTRIYSEYTQSSLLVASRSCLLKEIMVAVRKGMGEPTTDCFKSLSICSLLVCLCIPWKRNSKRTSIVLMTCKCTNWIHESVLI